MNSLRSAFLVLLPLLGGLILTSCDDGKPGSSGAASDSVGELAPAAEKPAQPQSGAADTAGPVITNVAVISTDLGDITLGLYGFDAPKTVQNFIGLAKRDFYDSIGFHRVVRGFVIQGGDPFSKDMSLYEQWGQGGESIYGDTFEDELDRNSPSGKIGYVTGTLAMANRGPNTNSSQFFIVLSTAGASNLPYGYTIFGTVLEGMDVVHKIEESAVDQNGNPVQLPKDIVRIKDVIIKDGAPSIQ